ncbi:hypothetical protein ACQ1R0_03890 [Ornithobacterium rhinotracheale]|uniref:hypothetical protein n=1 Tax=Ornithobacterium rhinotracheale TaxID=28251 RepID=UPI001FF55F24|nr:hypothetical protein [Ornithobacterium rhinotracheale]MCK0201394.1 hypothetical protein [Ornithobacterium rhinotracheale]
MKNNTPPVKLFEIEPFENIRRFRSQLFVDKNVADFIIKKGKMYCISGWKEELISNTQYVIINNRKEMLRQTL